MQTQATHLERHRTLQESYLRLAFHCERAKKLLRHYRDNLHHHDAHSCLLCREVDLVLARQSLEGSP